MKISDINKLDGVVCLQGDYEDTDVLDGYTSDLLSDVMAHAGEGSLLITIQAHKNTVAVCSLVGAVAMMVCSNRPVDDETIAVAAREGIAVFRTPSNQFQTSALIARHIHSDPVG